MFRFLGTFIGLEGKKQVNNIVAAMATVDPDTMSEAQLIEMERAVNNATQLFAKVKVDWQREEREAVEAERIVHVTVAGAEEIQRRLSAATDDAEKTKLNEALNLVVNRLEEVQASAAQERAEADDAKTLVDQAEQSARDMTTRLVAAKDTLKKGAREMQRANMRAENEEARAETAAQVAGLRSNDSGNLNAAVNAFQRSTDQANQRAEAARVKTEALTSATQKSGDGNALIADVMKSVEGKGSISSLSAAERLAILTGKTPQPAIPAPTPETPNHVA